GQPRQIVGTHALQRARVATDRRADRLDNYCFSLGHLVSRSVNTSRKARGALRPGPPGDHCRHLGNYTVPGGPRSRQRDQLVPYLRPCARSVRAARAEASMLADVGWERQSPELAIGVLEKAPAGLTAEPAG